MRKKFRSWNLRQLVSTVDPGQILAHESRPGNFRRALLHLPQSYRQDGDLQDVCVKLRLTGDWSDLEGGDQGLLHPPSQLPNQADQHLNWKRLRRLVTLVPLDHFNSPSSILYLFWETRVSNNREYQENHLICN